MTYKQYQINLIKETGARNLAEAHMIERLREHLPNRHRVTITSTGKAYKFDLDWVKELIKELRSYRKWLDWCEETKSEIPGTRESICEPVQLRLFDV